MLGMTETLNRLEGARRAGLPIDTSLAYVPSTGFIDADAIIQAYEKIDLIIPLND